MIDPIVRISLAVHANKGAYAVLLGSGVSAAAGIPTGSQIVSDLVTKVANLEGADVGDDPAAWYKQRYGEDPDYSGLLNAIASSPAERSLLLRSYFEPTDDERRIGVKVPTAAHRTMASLAHSGHVHLFLTTNFDRLLEKALDDVGIVPQVLSTPDSIGGAVPFGHTRCTVVKLNGDYMDTRIKNTPEELAAYDPAVDSLLDRVIDEYGFIVSGWSAESDAALRAAFERNQNQRYTVFWASRNPPRQDAVRLIKQRGGEFVKIKDPDTFFTRIGEGLAKLEGNVIPASDRGSPGDQDATAGSDGLAQASELPTGLITYLFTDVEGSTRLWQQYPHEMKNVMARHDSLLTSVVEENGGAVVRPRGEGDSIFAVFARATDAVGAACAAQQLLLREAWPEGIAINVRMALHTGESELREHDYYGSAVNRCARLRAIAHGGQVLLSQATVQLAQDTLPEEVSLRDMGSHRLKDLQRPEQVFQLIHPDLPADFPDLKSLDSHPHNLPVQLTSFIGREEEIGEVAGLLSTVRLVTLAGAGGSGKTRLAQEIGASIIEDYPDGVWFIGLASLSDPKMLRPHFADTFNVGEDALYGFLQRKSMLVILDNCEHLLAGAASLVQWLLSCPGVTVIATSREALNLAGERTFQVPPLPIPEDNADQDMLAGSPSVQLFLDRARAAKPAFELTAGNAVSVNQIVRRLDGIPLAIELAASRVKLLQPAEIASRLDECFKILTGGPVDALPHHQTLEKCIDWSYEMLDSDQQTLFRQLSVFRGGFTLPACGAVSGTDDEYEVLESLGQLVDKSLVQTMPIGEETRYNLLEPLLQYAAARITADEAMEAGGRHARYYRDLAEQGDPELRGPRQLEWLARLEREHDNLRAALAWGLEAGDADLPLRTAAALMWFWLIRRHVAEAVEWFDRVLATGGDSKMSRASALLQAGFISTMIRQNDLEGCRAQIREAQAQFVELGDEGGVKTAQNYEAVILWWQRDLEASSRRLAGIQSAHQTDGFEWGDAFCGWFLGSIAWLVGDMRQAHEHYTRVLEIFRRLGDLTFIAWTLLPLANFSLESGELGQATALYDESLAMMGDLGDRHGVGAVLLGLGTAANFRGEKEEAQRLLTDAQTNLREGGGGQGLSWPISNVLVDTRTHDLLVEATNRYQASLNLPPAEWIKMVCSDGEAWRARTKSKL